MQKLDRLEQMMKSVLQKRHWSGNRLGVLFKPRTIGLPIAADIAQTNSIVNHTLLLFLCLAYFIGCVTAIYLQFKFLSRTILSVDITIPLHGFTKVAMRKFNDLSNEEQDPFSFFSSFFVLSFLFFFSLFYISQWIYIFLFYKGPMNEL